MSRRSGTLQLTTPVESGEIVFRAGKVVAAFRTAFGRSLGEALLEAAVIPPTTYQDMLTAQKAGKRPPELFSDFHVDTEKLQQNCEELLKALIYPMFEWDEGTFSFVLEDSPDIWRGFSLEAMRVVAESGLNPQFLAMEGARLRDERSKGDTLSSFLKRSQSEPATSAGLGLQAVQQIAARLRTAADLDNSAYEDPFSEPSSTEPTPATSAAAGAAAAAAASPALDLSRDPLADGPEANAGAAAAAADGSDLGAPALPGGPAAGSRPADGAVLDETSEKVIPFPADRVRGRAAAASEPRSTAGAALVVGAATEYGTSAAGAAALATAAAVETAPAAGTGLAEDMEIAASEARAPAQSDGAAVQPSAGGDAAVTTEPLLPEATPEEPFAPAPAAAPTPVGAAAAGNAYRLLAIDDDPQVTRYIATLFAGHFVSIEIADTIKDAIAIIEMNPKHLVIATDLIIARSDGRGILGGIEILERIRQNWADLPVVLFTDYQNEEAEARARSMGALEVLLKPRKAQVQAAAKEGGTSPVVTAFLRALEHALSPFFCAPEQAAAIAAASAGQSGAASASADATVAPASRAHEAAPSSGAAPTTGAVAALAASASVASKTSASSPRHEPTAATHAELAGATDGGPATPMHREPAASTHREPSAPGSRAEGPPVSYDLGHEIAGEIEDLASPFDEELPPAVLSAGEMGTLRSMLAELIDPANRDTITLLVLRFASHAMERAGLFLATRRAFVGLGGFSIEESSDRFVSRVRHIQIPVDTDSVFSRVARYRALIRGPLKETEGNRLLIEGLGGRWPEMAVVAPLISGDRVAAILYGDNPTGKPLGPVDGLEIFLQQAGLAMDRALLERKLEEKKRHQGGSE